jgi:hypothetical protein
MNRTSPRAFQLGDIIPGHGKVVMVSETAYMTTQVIDGERFDAWIPFYGPNGVDTPAVVEPLVVLW